MQARNRFSGAFGERAGAVAAQLLDRNETATSWPENPAQGDRLGVGLVYLKWPGAETPQFWSDSAGLVTVAADARLWDADEVRADLERRGHVLTTGGAGELLLHLYLEYGPELGQHCRGMFVAAIVDRRDPQTTRLTLIRDPLGGRGALYYSRQRNTLAFSSTLRSLRRWTELPLAPNLSAVRDYLTYAFLPGEDTLLAGCYEVLPGHILQASYNRAGNLEFDRREYWRLQEGQWQEDSPVEVFSTPLRALLEQAVSERLSLSGPTAVLLSGGLDSSLVTALTSRYAPGPVHTFSISFGPEYKNELPFSNLVAEHCRTKHTVLTVSGADIATFLEETTARLDSPTGDPLTVPNFLLDRAASQASDIVLNGEGGDPCFGGPKNLPMMLHELYGDAGSALLARERNYLRSFQKCYDDLPTLLTARAHQELAQLPTQEDFLTPFLTDRAITQYLNKLMNINIRLKGSHQILYKVDRMTAAWGIEGRSPLFDRQVAEFSFTIPPHFKQAGTNEKYVLKKAVWDMLPEAILTRPKSGMLVPVQGWFKNELKAMATELLLGKRAASRDILNQNLIKEWLNYRENLFPRHGVKLWLLLTLEIYFRVFLDAPRTAPVLIGTERGL